MNNQTHNIDPSIAFLSESANTETLNKFFESKSTVIYRKLINAFSEEIQKDSYIAIDTSIKAEIDQLTIVDYGTDVERLGVKSVDMWTIGKVIAYSKPNDACSFTPVRGYAIESLNKITNQDLNRFENSLKLILNSGLINKAVYTDLSHLRSSLDTFRGLLVHGNQIKTAKVVKLEAIK